MTPGAAGKETTVTEADVIGVVTALRDGKYGKNKPMTYENVRAAVVQAVGPDVADAVFGITLGDALRMFTVGGLVKLVCETHDGD
jgi:hypothetical protein